MIAKPLPTADAPTAEEIVHFLRNAQQACRDAHLPISEYALEWLASRLPEMLAADADRTLLAGKLEAVERELEIAQSDVHIARGEYDRLNETLVAADADRQRIDWLESLHASVTCEADFSDVGGDHFWRVDNPIPGGYRTTLREAIDAARSPEGAPNA